MVMSVVRFLSETQHFRAQNAIEIRPDAVDLTSADWDAVFASMIHLRNLTLHGVAGHGVDVMLNSLHRSRTSIA